MTRSRQHGLLERRKTALRILKGYLNSKPFHLSKGLQKLVEDKLLSKEEADKRQKARISKEISVLENRIGSSHA